MTTPDKPIDPTDPAAVAAEPTEDLQPATEQPTARKGLRKVLRLSSWSDATIKYGIDRLG